MGCRVVLRFLNDRQKIVLGYLPAHKLAKRFFLEEYMLGRDRLPPSHDRSAFQHIAQFADIPWPWIGMQGPQKVGAGVVFRYPARFRKARAIGSTSSIFP
jgi:hypothetical protein